MNTTITIAGLQRLTLAQLRRLEAEVAGSAAAHAEGSAERRARLAGLALIRREIAIRLGRGRRPGL